MADKRRCKGTITNDKRGRAGQPCKLWARPGSDFCNRHNAPDGGGGPRNVESMPVRCIARSTRTGSQCKNAPLRGQRTCKFHGATRASAAKAQELLDRMVEPVLWELRDIALNPDTSESDRLRAIQMVLDRSIPRERKVEVEVKPWELTMQHVFKNAMQTNITRAAPNEMLADLDPIQRRAIEQSYIDAEVIEDDEDGESELDRHEREEAARREAEYAAEARDRARAALPQIRPAEHRNIDPPKRWSDQ